MITLWSALPYLPLSCRKPWSDTLGGASVAAGYSSLLRSPSQDVTSKCPTPSVIRTCFGRVRMRREGSQLDPGEKEEIMYTSSLPIPKTIAWGLSGPTVTDLRKSAGKGGASRNEIQKAGNTLMYFFSRVQQVW